MGIKLRNSAPMFQTELNPHWPDLDKLHATESESKLKQKANFNIKHSAVTPFDATRTWH